MQNATYSPWFPEPGSYIKFFDFPSREYRYRRLLWQRDPMRYPRRFPSVAVATKSSTITFKDINPSETKKHIYLAYLGLKAGFLYYLWHPFDIKNLKWDETANFEIDEDLTAALTYESYPFEFPTKMIGIEHDRYPSVQAYNISNRAMNPEVVWVASLYVVKEHAELSPDELSRLQSGQLRSYPTDFGGEL